MAPRNEAVTMMAHMRKAGLLGMAMLASSTAAHAQGCVLCYTAAASSGPGAMRALEFGIIALLTPALVLFLGVCGLIAYRARAVSAASRRPLMPAAHALLREIFIRKAARQRRSASATA